MERKILKTSRLVVDLEGASVVPSPGCRQRELLPLIGRQSLALLLDFRFRQPLSALWLWILFPPKNPISHLPRGKKNLAKQ